MTAIGRGEIEASPCRSRKSSALRLVANWRGEKVHVEQTLPDGQEIAVIIELPDGHVVEAARAFGLGAS